jgi:hypothetical protein
MGTSCVESASRFGARSHVRLAARQWTAREIEHWRSFETGVVSPCQSLLSRLHFYHSHGGIGFYVVRVVERVSDASLSVPSRLRNKNIDETQRKIAEQERAAAEMMKKKAEEERIAASSAAAAAAAVARRGAEQERAIAAAAAAAGKKRAEEERVAAERAAAEREAAEKKAQKENEARKKKESSAERDEEQERQRGASQAEKKKKKKSKKKGRGVGGEDRPEGLTWTGWTWFRNFLAVAVGVLALVLLVRVFVGTSGGAAKVGNDALNEKKQGHGFEKRFQEHAACSAYRDDLMHPEALQCFLQARQDAVKLHGKNAEIVGFIERSLGEIFTKRTKKNFIESRRHYIEGLRIAQITDGKMSEIAGDALDGIGVSHYLEGHYDKALQKFEEALKVFKEVLGAENDKVSRILQFLCTCYYHVGRAEDGLSAHEQSLQSVREKYGDNIQLANVHLNIATAPTTDGEMRVAHLNVQLQSAKEAMRIADKLGSSGPTVESQGRVDAATMAIKALMDRSVQPLLKEMGTHLCELDDDEDGEFDDELDDDEDGEFDYELDDDELDELRRIWRA